MSIFKGIKAAMKKMKAAKTRPAETPPASSAGSTGSAAATPPATAKRGLAEKVMAKRRQRGKTFSGFFNR